MRLFSYYILHSFKNQLKKLLKTWVLIFLVICALFGAGIGLAAASLTDSTESPSPDSTAGTEFLEEQEEDTESELILPGAADIGTEDIIELAAGGIILGIFLFMAFAADKSGSAIFLPADVDLLFASPMKPQSVLLFRLTTQLGAALLGSFYLLFQIPNLTLHLGLTLWAALALIAAWCSTLILATLLQLLLYALSSTHPAVKRFLRPAIYVLVSLTALGYFLTLQQSGAGYLGAAILFFNSKLSRFIPFWGWLKGFCIFAVQGNAAAAALCSAAVLAGGAALVYLIWHIKVDFYEDAMARSEETAELLEKAQAENSNGIVIRRKKDRSEKLRRDGFTHGCGANVFFFKTIYNRFRFAHMGFFTKTTGFYLMAALAAGSVCRFFVHTTSVLPVVLTLSALAFFRSLGNPLEEDTKIDYFVMIPENSYAKLFWSLAGGTVNCLLDLLLPTVAGALLAGADPFSALVWIPFIVSIDLYATNVGAFIGFSVPVAAGRMLKQIVQVLFVYFGLVPDIIILALGISSGHTAAAVSGTAVLNTGLALLFFALSPLFLGPHSGKPYRAAPVSAVDLHTARRQFSHIETSVFTIFAVTYLLQTAAGLLLRSAYPGGDWPSWILWVCTFAPTYIAAVPAGLLLLRRIPCAPPEKHSLKAGQMVSAFFICIFMMYAGNLFGNMVTSLLQSMLGLSSLNPVISYAMNGPLALKILVMVILAPLIEEYIFRRQLIDRMHIYGEKLAIFTSALIFGLFHGNLSQLFYAFALGLVFGYIYLRTGKLRYSAILHMLVNFIGSVVGPAMLRSIDLAALEKIEAADPAALQALISPQLLLYGIYILVLFLSALAGLVLLCIQSRNIYFYSARLELPAGTKLKTVYLNTGMLLLIVSCLISIAQMLM